MSQRSILFLVTTWIGHCCFTVADGHRSCHPLCHRCAAVWLCCSSWACWGTGQHPVCSSPYLQYRLPHTLFVAHTHTCSLLLHRPPSPRPPGPRLRGSSEPAPTGSPSSPGRRLEHLTQLGCMIHSIMSFSPAGGPPARAPRHSGAAGNGLRPRPSTPWSSDKGLGLYAMRQRVGVCRHWSHTRFSPTGGYRSLGHTKGAMLCFTEATGWCPGGPLGPRRLTLSPRQAG